MTNGHGRTLCAPTRHFFDSLCLPLRGVFHTQSKPPPRQFIQILRIARQHVGDKILGLGAVHLVQGRQLLFARGFKLAVAALAFFQTFDQGRTPVRRL